MLVKGRSTVASWFLELAQSLVVSGVVLSPSLSFFFYLSDALNLVGPSHAGGRVIGISESFRGVCCRVFKYPSFIHQTGSTFFFLSFCPSLFSHPSSGDDLLMRHGLGR